MTIDITNPPAELPPLRPGPGHGEHNSKALQAIMDSGEYTRLPPGVYEFGKAIDWPKCPREQTEP